jgi:hypothetical protein
MNRMARLRHRGEPCAALAITMGFVSFNRFKLGSTIHSVMERIVHVATQRVPGKRGRSLVTKRCSQLTQQRVATNGLSKVGTHQAAGDLLTRRLKR